MRNMLLDAAVAGWLWNAAVWCALDTVVTFARGLVLDGVMWALIAIGFAVWGWFKFRAVRRGYTALKELDDEL